MEALLTCFIALGEKWTEKVISPGLVLVEMKFNLEFFWLLWGLLNPGSVNISTILVHNFHHVL